MEQNDNAISIGKSVNDFSFNLLEMQNQLHLEEHEEKERHFKMCKAAVLDIFNALNFDEDAIEKIQAVAEHENLVDEKIFAMEQQLINFSYAQKLKLDIKRYSSLNSALETNLKLLQQEYEAAQENLNENKVSEEDIRQLQRKIKTYEMEVVKMDKRCPFLKENLSSLTTMVGEFKKLQTLHHQVETLQSEIDTFGGLKPNLNEARQQLYALKKEYERAVK